jgi:hypothetical protein
MPLQLIGLSPFASSDGSPAGRDSGRTQWLKWVSDIEQKFSCLRIFDLSGGIEAEVHLVTSIASTCIGTSS